MTFPDRPSVAGDPSVRHRKGLLITAGGTLLLSPDALIIRSLSVDQWTLVFWRGIVIAAGLLVGMLLFRRGSIRDRIVVPGRTGLLVGIFWGAAAILFVVSLTHTAVANTLVIMSSAPLFTAVLSRIFLREPVPRRTWIAVVMVVGAIGIIFADSLQQDRLLGDLAAVGGALAMAGTAVMIRWGRAVSMVPAVAAGNLFAVMAVAPLTAPLTPTAADVRLFLLLGLLLPLAVALITTGPRYLPAPEVRLLGLIETALGPLWVWWGLGEEPTRQALLAAAVIIPTLVLHSALGLREATNRTPEGSGSPAGDSA